MPVPQTAREVLEGMLWLYWGSFFLCIEATCATAYWLFGRTLFPFLIGGSAFLTWLLRVAGRNPSSLPLDYLRRNSVFPRPPTERMALTLAVVLLAYFLYHTLVLRRTLLNHLDLLAHYNGYERAYFHDLTRVNVPRLMGMPGIDERLWEGWGFGSVQSWMVFLRRNFVTRLVMRILRGLAAWIPWLARGAVGALRGMGVLLLGLYETATEQAQVLWISFLRALHDFLGSMLPQTE
ncbi:hypothetical protein B0T11DRAFT_284153 [Plectosphaerella cucumerina]|uniref:Uncharacterized protein n=1 Tax=Plectosphaerella cucumerina TaxID=40658 RepID=A0A8K0X136_9PEZI|nr:hypothetical protein B0T11DRAFT_284153 [Plectosphaerella cucumerina]